MPSSPSVTLTTQANAYQGAAREDAQLSLQAAAVPEPGPVALTAAGLALMLLRRRARVV